MPDWASEPKLRGMAGSIAVSGASGLIGGALVTALEDEGYDVFRMVRRRGAADSGEIYWNAATGEIDVERMEGLYGVVHLAGENIASGRWTDARKARIRSSRVEGTALIATTLAQLKRKPEVLISASAIGYYGFGDGGPSDESSPAGSGFLAEVCEAWEAAANPARDAGIRVVHPRIGVVLAKEGGALAKMKTPFSLGLGGKIGDGSQYMSWITLDDAVRALQYVLREEAISGPVNLVSPEPVTNATFTKALGTALGRPTVLPVPGFALRLAMGEMAEELLLGGAEVVPTALQKRGFRWEHPSLPDGLAAVLRG